VNRCRGENGSEKSYGSKGDFHTLNGSILGIARRVMWKSLTDGARKPGRIGRASGRLLKRCENDRLQRHGAILLKVFFGNFTIS
jgi:hypothetical protein